MDYVRHGKIQVGFKKDQIAALYFTMSDIPSLYEFHARQMTLVSDWSFVRHLIGFNRLFQEGFDQLQGGLSRRSQRLAIPRK